MVEAAGFAARSFPSMLDAADMPVDGHVHFHRLDLVPSTLDAAAAHFRRLTGGNDGLIGALLLTQARGEQVFEQLAALAGTACGDWALRPAAEPETLLALHDDACIALVCGRQVRASGGLEVLALGTRLEFPDGRLFEDTLAQVRSAGVLTALPWGFGKWWGRRGRRVGKALSEAGPRSVYVGDNSGRMQMLAKPALVARSENQGFRVLPGTDPFPFGADYRRVGGFGFRVEGPVTAATPWRDIRTWLDALGSSPAAFGRALSPGRFIVNQFGIQIYNRLFKYSLSKDGASKGASRTAG